MAMRQYEVNNSGLLKIKKYLRFCLKWMIQGPMVLKRFLSICVRCLSFKKQKDWISVALLLFITTHFVNTNLSADTVYFALEDLLHQSFDTVPAPQRLWLKSETQTKVAMALGHPYKQLRIRYWRKEERFLWILDEIGKEYPITAGFVVDDGKLMRAEVLIYRESRGSEIHLNSFLEQFEGNYLNQFRLAEEVDGITGATLSVDAMRRMASTALLLSKLVSESSLN